MLDGRATVRNDSRFGERLSRWRSGTARRWFSRCLLILPALTCTGQNSSPFIPTELSAGAALAFRAGLEAQRQGELKQALQKYSGVLQEYPSFAPALFNQGLILEKENDNKSALEKFLRISAIDPAYPHLQLFLGIELFKTHDPRRAEAALESATRSDSDDDQGWFWLARDKLELGKYAEAFNAAQRARTKSDTPSSEFLIARIQSDSGDWEAAEVTLKALIATFGYFPGVHELLGDVYYHEARSDEAMAEFVQEIKDRPASVEANAMIGIIDCDRGAYSDAVPHLLTAVQTDSGQPKIQNALALALWKMGRPKEALEHARVSEGLDPKSAQVHFLLWKVYGQLSDSDLSQRELALYKSAVAR